jgi:hypothetical protein
MVELLSSLNTRRLLRDSETGETPQERSDEEARRSPAESEVYSGSELNNNNLYEKSLFYRILFGKISTLFFK